MISPISYDLQSLYQQRKQPQPRDAQYYATTSPEPRSPANPVTLKPFILYLALQWLLALTASAATPTYDLDGRLIRMTSTDGSAIDYPRDSNGNQLDRIVTRPVELTLTVDPPGSGTVTGAGRYLRNTTQALTATAGSAFVFDAWKKQDGTVLSTNTNYTHTVTAAEILIAHFIPHAPEIVIEDPSTTPATDLVDGVSSLSFGSQLLQSTTPKTLTIRNTGNAPLNGLSLTVDGSAGTDFSTSNLPTSIAAGGSATLTIQFAPAVVGTRSAALHIASNDSDENPFDIALTGSGVVSSDANLINLTLSAGTLSPSFTSATTSYTASVSFNTSAITVTPTVAQANASVSINGSPIPSGTARSIALGVGSNVIATIVTAQDGTTIKTYSVSITRRMRPGDLESGFNPNPNGSVVSMAVQPDGKILIGGYFTTVGGVARRRLALLNADGTLDASFDPNVNSGVTSMTLQEDGKVLIGGFFTTVGATARSHLARLNSDGTLDTGFNPGANEVVYSMAVQADGKTLLGGEFTTLGGATRNRIARLNADGTLDAAFNPNASYDVYSMAVQPDGKILIGGGFNSVGGVAISRLARLNADGTVDVGFNPYLNGTVECITVQADGKILIGGGFVGLGGAMRNNIGRLNPDGSLDTSFDPNVDSLVLSAIAQADGKILVGGHFTTVGGVIRHRLARLNSDGTLDVEFDPDLDNHVLAIAQQADGKILVGGVFGTVGGMIRNCLSRLNNDLAAQSLSVTGASRIEWLRGSTSPEASQVIFELSPDGITNFTVVGAGSRISGGWERAILSPPIGGYIRARARTIGGQYNGSSSLVETVTAFGVVPVPEIAVEQPVGTNIADGDSTDCGNVAVGAIASLSFNIKNIGSADLTLSGMPKVAVSGTDAALFTVTAQPTSPVTASGCTTFTVSFAPTGTGVKTAAFSIANNDDNENPFDITLTGTGLTQSENWRRTYFGTTSNTGNAADSANPQGDGIVNLMKFATAMDPTKPGVMPGVISRVGGNLVFTYTRNKAAVSDGVTVTVEWSDSLAVESWSSTGVDETALDQGSTEFVSATVPAGTSGRRFVHLRVTRH